MEAILGFIVANKVLLIIISVVLILALIGALADRGEAKRFALNTEKMRTNVTKETVDEANKTAGEAPEVTNTSITSGTEFTAAPVNSNVQEPEVVELEQVKVEPTTETAEVSATQTK